MKYKDIQKELKKELKTSRYEHTLGVVETAEALAETYGCDEEKAKYAALLHDCAKSLSGEEKIALCREYDVAINDVELQNPSLLHAKCGAILAKHKYGIDDPEILHAIAVHTTGVPEMNLLDEIIFVADYIEPGRESLPNLHELRRLAYLNLEATVCQILSDTVTYLNSRREQRMDPTTLAAYEYYRDKLKTNP